MRTGHTLAILRHAKSAWPEGIADQLRPLAARGQRDAPMAGRWLAGRTPVQLLLCSPARRARETAELVVAELDPAPDITCDERIYAGGVDGACAVLRELPASLGAVALIGHNPTLEELVDLLGGRSSRLKTSSIAVLESRSPWADIGSSGSAKHAWGRLTAEHTARG